MEQSDHLADAIKTVILRHVAESPDNDLGLQAREKIFDPPLVGFSRGSDPLYDEFRRHIGEFYFTPVEMLNLSFPDLDSTAELVSVISWILPSTAVTRSEQAEMTRYPSQRWVHTRAMGEEFNNSVRRVVLSFLAEHGIPAVAPLLSPLWSRFDEGPYAPCSNWSERHAAYAAGLGTFGLCDGLITPVGKAVRVGSVITATVLPPSPRSYHNHHDWCLHFNGGNCGACIRRCPVNALSEKGHDKNRCMQYTEQVMNRYIKEKCGLDTYACGLCQAGVPCTDTIPNPFGK